MKKQQRRSNNKWVKKIKMGVEFFAFRMKNRMRGLKGTLKIDSRKMKRERNLRGY